MQEPRTFTVMQTQWFDAGQINPPRGSKIQVFAVAEDDTLHWHPVVRYNHECEYVVLETIGGVTANKPVPGTIVAWSSPPHLYLDRKGD